jgi:hypothetical protein
MENWKDQLCSFIESNESMKDLSSDRQRKSLISTNEQGVVKWVYSNIFQRKTHDWAYNN